MVKTKPAKATVQSQATSTSLQPIVAISTEQPRHMSQSIGPKKRKPGSKTKAVEVVPKPLANTGVKAKTLELPSGRENRLETISVQSSTLPNSAPQTMRGNSSSSDKEELTRAMLSSKFSNRQKSKKDAKSSVDVERKQEQNCENCGFAKIVYVVDRCTSMVDSDGNRLSVNSNVDEVIKAVMSSETVLLDDKTLAAATQTGNSSHSVIETDLQLKARTQGCPSDCPAFREDFCETCGRPMQTSGDELRRSKEEPIENLEQLKYSERTEPGDQKYLPKETISRQHDYPEGRLKPRYYETESSAQANHSGIEYLAKSPRPQQCGPCGRFNYEKCNFDCSARRFSDRQCASCGRPNDKQMPAPLVSFKSSTMFDSASLPYQRTAKSLDIENYGSSMLGQYERNHWSREPMEEFQKEFIAQPNEKNRRLDYSYFEEEPVQCCNEYERLERKNEKPPSTKRLSQSPAEPKCNEETCSQNCCRRCSRRNTEAKPSQQGLTMNAQQIRSKSKSPSGRSRYPPRSVFSVDNNRSAEYLAMQQYRQGVNDEIARANVARNIPFDTNVRRLPSVPPQQFDRCCQSTQASCSANKEPSQSQRRRSAAVQNTSTSTQTCPRTGSVDSINIDHGNQPVGGVPDLATMPGDPRKNGTYENQKNISHPHKDCKCCCCCQRRLEEKTRASGVATTRKSLLDEQVERKRSIPLEERLSQIQNHAAVLAITSRLHFGSSEPDSEFNCQHYERDCI